MWIRILKPPYTGIDIDFRPVSCQVVEYAMFERFGTCRSPLRSVYALE